MTEKEMAELGAVTLQAFFNKFGEPKKQIIDNITNLEVVTIVLEELMNASIRDIVHRKDNNESDQPSNEVSGEGISGEKEEFKADSFRE